MLAICKFFLSILSILNPLRDLLEKFISKRDEKIKFKKDKENLNDVEKSILREFVIQSSDCNEVEYIQLPSNEDNIRNLLNKNFVVKKEHENGNPILYRKSDIAKELLTNKDISFPQEKITLEIKEEFKKKRPLLFEFTIVAGAEEEINKKWEDLFFEVRRSIRYHSKRAGFFDFLNKMITAISIVAGSAVIATAFGSNSSMLQAVFGSNSSMLQVAFGIIVASLSTISLAFGYSSREQLHNELKREFIMLERSMIKCDYPDDNIYKKKHARMLSIEANEPAVVRALNAVCYNEQAEAQGSEDRDEISWFRSLFCQIDFYTAISFLIAAIIIIIVFVCVFIYGENKLNFETLQNLKSIFEPAWEATPKAQPVPSEIH